MRDFLFLLVTAALCTASLLSVVSRRNADYDVAYAIGRATQAQRALEEERKRLTVDRASLLDPGRLAPIARRLGYDVASPDQVVVLRLPAGEGRP
jgi:cell division protein FtsL